jgi:molecular chaperone HscB
MDYFGLFGFDPPRLTLDPAQLQNRFYELSREYHPDRFATRPADERERAESISAHLNDAYRTLRDPLARAEYLLAQRGLDIETQSSKHVPPELLEEVFEMNIALEELRSGDQDARPQLEAEAAKFRAMLEEADAEAAREFAAFDQGDAEALGRLRAIYNRRRYIANLVRDAERTLAQ